jgi:hypothetical protein
MSNYGWINKDLILDWLRYFLKFKYEGRALLVPDKHEAIQVMEPSVLKIQQHRADRTVLQPLDPTQEVHQGIASQMSYGMEAQNSNLIRHDRYDY